MRWKILFIASLIAAMVGASPTLGLAYGSPGAFERLTAQPVYILVVLLVVPLAATTFASIFVYRHTARRRLLQAMATVLLTAILTLAAIIAGLKLFTTPARAMPNVPPQTTSLSLV